MRSPFSNQLSAERIIILRSGWKLMADSPVLEFCIEGQTLTNQS